MTPWLGRHTVRAMQCAKCLILALALTLTLMGVMPACGSDPQVASEAAQDLERSQGASDLQSPPVPSGSDVVEASELNGSMDGQDALGSADVSLPELDAQAPDASGPSLDARDDTSPPGDSVASGPLGTWDNPILVTGFPFTDSRDTANAPSPVFDSYGCALETNEGGDGFVYRVDVANAGVLELQVNDVPGDGVDVDVHLLSDRDPASCLIRDNVALSWPVTPGTYWIVTDTWVNAEGQALAGPYILDVSFVSDTADEAPYGSLGNPIIVDGFPFSDSRDTASEVSDFFDSYSCAIDTDESGPEIIYALNPQFPGLLSVSVSDDSGVDVDVHLLSALNPNACVARNDVGFSEHLEPGLWYVVVDSWVDEDGVAWPGPYTLDISFEADMPDPVGYGSFADPILVDNFPFFDARDTTVAPSDEVDAYACQPDTDESGHEFVYAVTVPTAGILSAGIDELLGDGIDVDVHLLSAPGGDTCLARGDRNVAHPVSPGVYWVVVDTYVNGDGKPLAGPYNLLIDLIPTPTLSDFCLIVYGDTRGKSSSDPQDAHKAVVASMQARCESAAYLHTGDFVRSGYSDADWETFVSIEGSVYANGAPLYPTRGNHDGSWANVKTQLAPLLPQPPESSTYVRELSPGLNLLVLDSEEDASSQVSWLQAQFDAPEYAGDLWIVSFHRPLYPSVGGHAGWSPGKTHWAPRFTPKAGRIMVATGHCHGMSREKVDNVDYLTAGGGGAPLYGCSKAHADTRFCKSTYGYTSCDAQLRCVTWQVDLDGGPDQMIDAFRVQ